MQWIYSYPIGDERLSFAKLESVLARHLGVHDDRQRVRLRARLKQLQRFGCPHGVNNGREARVSYSAGQLLEVAFVLELLRCGLTPERCLMFVRTWWDWLRRAFLTARDHEHPVLIAFSQGDFVGLDRSEENATPVVTYSEDGCAIIGIDPTEGQERTLASLHLLARSRVVALNMTDLLTSLTAGMRDEGVESAFVWAETERWRADRDQLGRSLDPRAN